MSTHAGFDFFFADGSSYSVWTVDALRKHDARSKNGVHSVLLNLLACMAHMPKPFLASGLLPRYVAH